MNDPRGSIWRKWDLHIHTPESYHQQFGRDWDTFVLSLRNKAVEHDIEVAVINDYFSVDGYAKLVDDYCEEKYPHPSLKLENGKHLYLLPGIELRLSIFDHDDDAVNLHIVFDSLYLPDNIRSGFIEKLSVKYGEHKLNCKRDDLIKIGHAIEGGGKYDENLDLRQIVDSDVRKFQKRAYSLITLDVDDIDKGLKQLEENLIKFERRFYLKLIAYKGHGSLTGFNWFDIQRQEGRAGNNKRILLNNSDICFTNSSTDKEFLLGLNPTTPYHEIIDRFRTIKPSVWGSDAHSLDKLFYPSNGATNDYTWIKADPTFEGLRQILYEPDSRVYIGVIPNKLINVEENKHLYIDNIKINTDSNNGEWFDQIPELPLNTGLVSIIGNKGAGKSALADIIAATGNCENDTYSFLSVDKFLKLDQRQKYSSLITFLDETSDQKEFANADYNSDKPSKVVYLSQSFVRDMCESEDITKLQREINRVLSSHIPIEEKFDADNLDEIIRQRIIPFNDTLTNLIEKLHKQNEDIVTFEGYKYPQFRQSKVNKLAERRKELVTYESNFKKLPAVSAPKKEENQKIINEVALLRKEIIAIDKQARDNQESLNTLSSELQQIEILVSQFRLYEKEYAEITQKITDNALLLKYGISLKDLINVTVNAKPLKDVSIKISSQIGTLRKQKEEIDKRFSDIQKAIKEKENLLGLKEKGFQDYQTKLNQWEQRKKEIEGDSKAPDTIKNLEAWIGFVDSKLDEHLAKLLKERRNLVDQIIEVIHNKKETYESLFSYGKNESEKIAQKAKLPPNELIHFQVNLRFNSKFEDEFLDMISHSKSGTFYGKESGLKELKKIKNTVALNDIKSLADLPNHIVNALQHDLTKLQGQQATSLIDEQLTEGYTKIDLYNYLYSMNYIEVAVEIEHRGRRLEDLSPGEKGTVLLIFYLLLDKDRRPLIIDQPEENLDNETIFLVLVQLIKQAKEERQIIIVTHNPNLAVVCDSEQIIHASMKKDANYLVTYDLGSIEKSEIRNEAINILEGTDKAFTNRQNKYRLINRTY